MTVEDDRRNAVALQKSMIEHDGEAYVEACPGAGKTRTLVERFNRLTATGAPRKGIAVLSFTNAAVDEFKARCQSTGLMRHLGFPNYIGTFDAFLNHFIVMPFGAPQCADRPILVDNWDRVEVTPGIRRVAARPVALSLFDAATGSIEPSSFRDARVATVVRMHQQAYELEAKRRREVLNRKGYLSPDDARLVVKQFLEDQRRADAVGQALAARFSEIIVDEAQDCNTDDVAVLHWLKNHDLKLMLVCDPDQAIFGFRKGSSEAFQNFANGLPSIKLTGNFRSSSNICGAAATMRKRVAADLAVGDHHDLAQNIILIPYGKRAGAEIGALFKDIAGNCELTETIVLAHKRRLAQLASGFPLSKITTGSKLAQVTNLVVAFHDTTASGRQRESTLKAMVRLLMTIEGVNEDDVLSLRPLIESNEVHRYHLRRAIQVLSALPDSLDGMTADEWADRARNIISCAVTLPTGKTIKQLLPGVGDWSNGLQVRPSNDLSYATIHEAKGRDYDAVCLVLEKESRDAVAAWESRGSDTSEDLRVLYVGVTRAKKLLAIAAPDDLTARIEKVLSAASVPCTQVPLTTASHNTSPQPAG